MTAPVVDDAQARARIARVAGMAREHRTGVPGREMVWREWRSSDPAAGTVVLLHGGSGSWTHWLLNIEPLLERHRVFAADLPGLGDSWLPSEPYDADSLADIVRAGIATLLPGDEPYHLVGFSFGGIVAGHLAARGGARLRALTIIGAPPFGLAASGRANDLRAVPPDMSLAEATPLHRHNLETLMFADPACVDPLSLRIHHDNLARGRLRSRRIARDGTLAGALARFEGRLHGIWGEHDVTLNPDLQAVQALFLELGEGNTFDVITDAGHWVMYEAPDAFNAVLARRLAGRDT
jgi:pimeloyl-ACP methyl ester carboxylesterase